MRTSTRTPACSLDQVGQRRAGPRRGEIDLPAAVADDGRAGHLPCQVRDQLLGQLHHVAVVGVGLVQLEHRELGVVAGRQALVAEHPSELEHALEPADHQPLQVQLGGDAQVEVEVEGVVVGGERPGQRPAGDGMQQRGLDLDEAAVLEEPAGLRHDAAAGLEHPHAVVVGPQVRVALAVAEVGVGDALPLVAEAPAGLGEQLPLLHAHRQLAPAGPDDLAGGDDPVSEVERGEVLVVVTVLGGGHQLDRPARITQRCERPSTHVAQQHDPARHGDGNAAVGAVGQVGVRVLQVRGPVGDLGPVGGPELRRRVLGHWFFS